MFEIIMLKIQNKNSWKLRDYSYHLSKECMYMEKSGAAVQHVQSFKDRDNCVEPQGLVCIQLLCYVINLVVFHNVNSRKSINYLHLKLESNNKVYFDHIHCERETPGHITHCNYLIGKP